jgi:hypothetical protein
VEILAGTAVAGLVRIIEISVEFTRKPYCVTDS